MKKILPVFLAIIIFFTSTLMQVNKAHAVGQLAVPLAAGSGAGYAAVGAYVIGGLLVAGGAAVILDDPDSADKIRQHSMRVWEGFDSATKSAWIAAIDASVSAGKSTLELTDTMTQSISDGISLLGNSAEVIVSEKNLNVHGLQIFGMNDSVWQFGLGTGTGAYFTYRGHNLNRLFFIASDPDNGTYTVSGPGAIYESVPYSGKTDRYDFYRTDVKTYSDFLRAFFNAGIPGALPVFKAVNFPVPSTDYYADSVGKAVDRLKGIKEVYFDKGKWVPLAAGGAILVGDSAGAPTLPDGTPYTGDITWDYPKIGVPAIPDVSAPSVPIDDVVVGDIPFVGAPDVVSPPVAGDTGILQGLWDWLKGILQAILDAIIALASLVGLIGIINSILTFVESISESITSWKDTPSKKINWSKLSVAAGALTGVFPFSIPWDVYRLFSVFNVAPITPVFKINSNKTIEIFNTSIPIKYDFDVDFSVFNPIAAIGRWGLILIFDISIIMALRRLTPD